LEFALLLAEGRNKFVAYRELQMELPTFLVRNLIEERQIAYFDRLFKGDIFNLPESEIASTGYVVHTLEASIWCILTTDCYKDAVLCAVNLGEDTDTTAAVTGALAGLIYGLYKIPEEWIQKLARKEDIEDLAIRLAKKMDESWGYLW
jgi:ADP-ribosyl-[dinitrogen reductase] hydrolase